MAKGIALYSGGLDSILSIQLILDQGCEVECIAFKTPLFGPKESNLQTLFKGRVCCTVYEKDITEEFLKILASPDYGFGKNLNPCIDCKILMLTQARSFMIERCADFVFTGEVLGQRPMSQRRDTLNLIEKGAGLTGRLLRPLSAKLLPITIIEEKGLIDRGKLLDISGRSRKRQIEMARRMNWYDFPRPGGGCLLTDPSLARRLKPLLTRKDFSTEMLKWLKIGRHFDYKGLSRIVVGRNELENDMIQKIANKDDIILETVDIPGPVTVVIGNVNQETIRIAATITASYSDAGEKSNIRVTCVNNKNEINVPVVSKGDLEDYMIK